jgi:hypothetical protein
MMLIVIVSLTTGLTALGPDNGRDFISAMRFIV